MYKNKLSKYQHKLEQYGGLICPYKVNDRVIITKSDNAALLYKIGIITKLHYNAPEGAYYFNPICNKININIDGNIHSVSTLNIKKFTDLTPKLLLSIKIDSIPLDTIKEIFKNLNMFELIDIYNNTTHIQLKEAINKYPFDFYNYSVPRNMSLKEFRDIFGNAIGINISFNTGISEIDFITNILPRTLYTKFSNTRQLKVNIAGCTQLTDRAFIPLNNYIHTLNMRECNQETITDAAFVHLKGIHTIVMPFCDQRTITDAAFKYLAGVHTLNIMRCDQETITDAAFVNLKGVRELDMRSCKQKTITDAAFKHLANVHTLDISGCNQKTITDSAFIHLVRVHMLLMSYCNQNTITDAAFKHLANVHTLNISGCNQNTITDAAFTYLKGVKSIDMQICNQETINGNGFCNLNTLTFLNIYGCNQATLDAANRIFGITENNSFVQYFKPCV